MKLLLLKYKYVWLAIACVVSRLVTTVYYIEDPDSLHFALAATDFDVANFQPHFPGYPVFCFLVQLFTLLTGKFSLAFSIVGGLSTFAIVYFGMKISSKLHAHSKELLVGMLLFFNPFIWLMSNRYMPDLMGVAVLMGAFYFLLKKEGKSAVAFQALTGLLAGVRLSLLPFLLVPSVYALITFKKRGWQILAGIAGVLIWLVPMIIDTGWNELILAAQKQTHGHFHEWGGTISDKPLWLQRATEIFRALWADGLGGYWYKRNWVTIISGFGALTGLLSFFAFRKRSRKSPQFQYLLVVAALGYLLWIFFYQNVLYKPRHALPLVPFFVMIVGVGYSRFIDEFRAVGSLSFALTMAATIFITIHLTRQHRQPTAIYQAKELLEQQTTKQAKIISIPLINEFMRKQGVKGEYLSVESDTVEIRQAVKNGENVYSVGEFELIERPPKTQITFYHNPYVNRMWPAVMVNEY